MKPSRSSGAPNPGRRSAGRAETTPASASSESSGDALTGSLQPQRPSRDEIARRAYQHWEDNGRQDGTDQDHWFSAERELQGASGDDSASTAEEGPEPSSDETRRSEP